jgi:hypothetical protein
MTVLQYGASPVHEPSLKVGIGSFVEISPTAPHAVSPIPSDRTTAILSDHCLTFQSRNLKKIQKHRK